MIEAILKKHLYFEGARNENKFISMFFSLYRIELFKDGLDLILTKLRQGDLKFTVKITKGWDTNEGCCATEKSTIYDKIHKSFISKYHHHITIRSFEVNVMAHEMAHALSIESGLVLNDDFRKAIAFDMNDREAPNIALRAAIKRIMVEGVKSYKADNVLGELFARYFELLSLSRNVSLSGDFTTSDVMDFFVNTTKWFYKIFDQKIHGRIDPDIASQSYKMLNDGRFNGEKKFTEKVDSFYKKLDSNGQKSWGANIRSNNAWQDSWKQYQKNIDQDKK